VPNRKNSEGLDYGLLSCEIMCSGGYQRFGGICSLRLQDRIEPSRRRGGGSWVRGMNDQSGPWMGEAGL
jgi:hypothetical protein